MNEGPTNAMGQRFRHLKHTLTILSESVSILNFKVKKEDNLKHLMFLYGTCSIIERENHFILEHCFVFMFCM